jgi:hypothetical protein
MNMNKIQKQFVSEIFDKVIFHFENVLSNIYIKTYFLMKKYINIYIIISIFLCLYL